MPLVIRGNILQSRGRVDWLPTGNAAQPSLTFSTDPDTGLYRPAEDQLALSTGGTDRLLIHALGATVNGNLTATGLAGNAHNLEHIQVENIDGLNTALDDLTNNSVTTNVITVSGNVTAAGFVGNAHQLEHIQVENIDGLSTALNDINNNTVTTNVITVSGNVTAAGFVGNGHQISHIQVANIDGLSTALNDIDNNSVTTNVLTVNGNITTTGNVLAGGDVIAFSSDERLKTNVEPITGALGTLDSINGYRFTWRDDIPGLPMRGRDMGLLAQDLVRAGATECVTLAPFDRDPQTGGSKSGEHYLTVSYNKVHAISIAAIKELVARVDALQARVEVLEKREARGTDP